MRILVIDDDPSIKLLLRHFLEQDHEITECSSGNEAIELLRTDKGFSLIVCDYEMPNGNGLQVLEHLSSEGLDLNFILFTSFPNLEIPIPYDNFLGVYEKLNMNRLLEDISKKKFPN